MLEHKSGSFIDEKWLTEFVDPAEKDWGLENINLVEPADCCKHILTDYARDRVILHLQPGRLYTFKNIDDDTSVDRIFLNNATHNAESEMDYVND